MAADTAIAAAPSSQRAETLGNAWGEWRISSMALSKADEVRWRGLAGDFAPALVFFGRDGFVGDIRFGAARSAGG